MTWTLDPEEAEKDPKDGSTPLPWGSKLKDGKWKHGEGKPSEAVHGNVTPNIDVIAGGVTIDHAEQTVVLSIAALRRLSFGAGSVEARMVLVALGLLAILAAQYRGHDLRSRCLLVPREGSGSLKLEWIATNGATDPITLSRDEAIKLYADALALLPEDLRFTKWGDHGQALKPGESIAELEPSDKLRRLVKRSRELAMSGADAEED